MKDYIYTSINHIKEAIENNRLILFVGAGLSMNSGLPSWNDLIHSFAVELGERYTNQNKKYSLSEALKIPQVYYNRYSHNAYYRKLTSQIKTDTLTPSIVHRALFECQPAHIITTNYDDLIERESKNHLRNYHVVSANEDLPYAQSPNLIIKMHGDIHRKNTVLKEDDYLSYEKNFKLISTYVKSLFTTHVVLFVGFSVTDINFNIIYQWVRDILQDDALPAYLLEPTEKFNVDEYQYYKQRGINLLYYNDVENNIVKTLQNTTHYADAEKLGKIGRNAYCFLRYLNNTSIASLDDIYKMFLPYSEVRSLLPTHIESVLNMMGLQAQFDYNVVTIGKESAINEIFKEIDTTDKLRIEIANKNTARYLWNILRKSLILQVNNRRMSYSLKLRPWSFSYKTFDYLALIEEFNYEEIEKKITILNFIISDDTLIENLEKAFLLVELGRLEEAYNLYKNISIVAAAHNRYWIAFTAKYNMKRVFYLLFNNAMLLPINSDILFQMKAEVEGINIKNDFKHAPEPLRELMFNVESRLLILEKRGEMDQLLDEVNSDAKHFANGGFKYGEPVTSRGEFILQSTLCFLHYNNFIYKYNDEYNKLMQSYCKIVYIRHFIDCSYDTNPNFPLIKEVEEIDYETLYYSIISFATEQLVAFFKDLKMPTLQVEDNTKIRLIKGCDNLLKYAAKYDLHGRVFFLNRFLSNQLLILSKIELNGVEITLIIAAVNQFFQASRPIPKDLTIYLYEFLDKQYQYQAADFPASTLLVLLESFIHRMTLKNNKLLPDFYSWKFVTIAVHILQAYNPDLKLNTTTLNIEQVIKDVLNGWTQEKSEKTNELIQGVLIPMYPIVSFELQDQISRFLCKRFVLEWYDDSFGIFYDVVVKKIIQTDDTLYQFYLSNLHKQFTDLQNSKNTLDISEIELNFRKVGRLIDDRSLLPSKHRDILNQLRKNYPFLDYVLSPKTKYDYSNFQVVWFEWLLPTSIDKILKNKVAVPILLQKLQDALQRDGKKAYVDLFIRFLKKKEGYKK